MRRYFICLTALFLVACGKDNSSSSSSSSSAPSIEGTWKSECIGLGDGIYVTFVMVNSSEESVLDTTLYLNDDSCILPRLVDSQTRTYAIGDAVAGLTDTYKINITFGKITRTYTDESEVAVANSDSAFGYSDWALSEGKDITGKKYNDSTEPQDAEGTAFYQIFKIENNKYYPGDTSIRDGSSEEQRPNIIKSGIGLTKQ